MHLRCDFSLGPPMDSLAKVISISPRYPFVVEQQKYPLWHLLFESSSHHTLSTCWHMSFLPRLWLLQGLCFIGFLSSFPPSPLYSPPGNKLSHIIPLPIILQQFPIIFRIKSGTLTMARKALCALATYRLFTFPIPPSPNSAIWPLS